MAAGYLAKKIAGSNTAIAAVDCGTFNPSTNKNSYIIGAADLVLAYSPCSAATNKDTITAISLLNASDIMGTMAVIKSELKSSDLMATESDFKRTASGEIMFVDSNMSEAARCFRRNLQQGGEYYVVVELNCKPYIIVGNGKCSDCSATRKLESLRYKGEEGSITADGSQFTLKFGDNYGYSAIPIEAAAWQTFNVNSVAP